MTRDYSSFESFCKDTDLIEINSDKRDIAVNGIRVKIKNLCIYRRNHRGSVTSAGKEYVVIDFKKLKISDVGNNPVLGGIIGSTTDRAVELKGLGRILAYNSSDLLSVLAQKMLQLYIQEENNPFSARIIQYPLYKKDPTKNLIVLSFFSVEHENCDYVGIEDWLDKFYLDFRLAVNRVADRALNNH